LAWGIVGNPLVVPHAGSRTNPLRLPWGRRDGRFLAGFRREAAMACATWQARSPAHLWMVSRY